MSADVEQLEAKLAKLCYERDGLASARTREDVRQLAESWLAAACARHNGTAGFVLNGHANPPEIQSVIAEFLLDSPALLDFIVKKVEATTELTNRQRDQRLRKLSAEITEVEKQHLEARKAAAMAQLEAEFAPAGEAA